MSRRRHVLVYGDLNLNIVDGSATWLTSLVETLALTDSTVHLVVRAPITTERLIGRVRGLENVVVHEPGRNLPQRPAVAHLEAMALEHDFSAFITRGRDFSQLVAESDVLGPILWSYVTDFSFPLTAMPAEELAQMRQIAAKCRYLFLQTEESRDYIEAVVPEAANKTLLMTPTVPDALFRPLRPKPAASALRLIYAGKFHPHWRTLEMLDLPARLREAGVPATLTMLGDKFQGNADWSAAMLEGLEGKEGVSWGGGVAREEVVGQLEQHDVGLSWRTSDLDSSLELSTKLLEYAAAGTPPVPNRTRAHEALLGSDYPLLLDDDSVETLVEVLRRHAGGLEPLRRRAQDAARRYSSSVTSARLEGYLQRAESLTNPALGLRVSASSLSPFLLGDEIRNAGAEVTCSQWRPGAPLEPADLVVADGPAALWHSRHKLPGMRLAVRLAAGERVDTWPGASDEVDIFILPTEPDQTSGSHRQVVIPESIDTVGLARPKVPGAAHRLGMTEVDPTTALLEIVPLMEQLVALDARFHLEIRASLPWTDPDRWGQPDAAELWHEFFRRLAASPARDAVSFKPPGPDLVGWLRTIGWLLCPGDVAELTRARLAAMASGTVPVFWGEPSTGAAEQFRRDANAVASWITDRASTPGAMEENAAAARQLAEPHDVWHTRNDWSALLRAAFPGERHLPTLRKDSDSKTISVILPCYRSLAWMPQCLDSLLSQTLPSELFEIVLIFNGPDDGAEDYAREQLLQAQMNFQILHSDPGASTARNTGTRHATGQWHTFIDVDDRVTDNYLEALWRSAGDPKVVPLATMLDVHEDGTSRPSAAHDQIMRTAPGRVSPGPVARAMTITVLKLLPANVSRRHPFDPALRSGEDVALFFALFEAEGLDFDTTPAHEGAVYLRLIRDGSVSRQGESYDFMVSQRLAVMEALERPFQDGVPQLARVIDAMISSQADMVRNYARRHAQHQDDILADIQARGLKRFPLWKLPQPSDKLVIAYAFAPYNDPSALVTMKRVIASGERHNAISADMQDRRKTDYTLAGLASQFVGEHRQIPGATVWNWWPGIESFCQDGWDAVLDIELGQPRQREIYSRALWVPAHFLAALIKARRPDSTWTAEFSDPLRKDVLDRERPGVVADTEVSRELSAHLRSIGWPVGEEATLFHWAEHLAYAMADRIVFTNPHQLTYMISYLDDPALRDRVLAHAVISPQPTLPEEFYAMGRQPAVLDPDQLHLAYFGSFYPTRGLADVLDGLRRLDAAEAARVRIHVFTPTLSALNDALQGHPYRSSVVGYHPLAYLDFLRASATYDALIVNDADTSTKESPINPYLPSKLSDYMGSGAPVWAIVEPGSILSRADVAHSSRLGDATAAVAIIKDLQVKKLKDQP